MGKVKKEKRKSEGGEETEKEEKEETWEQKTKYMCAIAQPLASRKLTKRLYKVIKKAGKQNKLRKGVREVQKYVRKGEKGIMVIAGDVSPVDVISHMPLVCEESNIPYCYVPSKDDLGSACGSKRQTCMLLIKSHEDYQDIYDEAFEDLKSLPAPY
ncbi:H/ACA ribonucleoprotein complex subunit 2-like protein [Gigantopelta aegis]|uniref:H/ACA ribonucleoprotein complex subunit 2-like protein n=1 Tax=Gigantopelta aegis TaxID=1735272 RepID=UPI001B88AF41|nr:H/ACA ribonucleoprotein complex subunit 2-like protein [Gigantopelta aegis]